jgi:hypothetical protein
MLLSSDTTVVKTNGPTAPDRPTSQYLRGRKKNAKN